LHAADSRAIVGALRALGWKRLQLMLGVSLTRKYLLLYWHHDPAGRNADAPEAERLGIRRGGELVCGVEETA